MAAGRGCGYGEPTCPRSLTRDSDITTGDTLLRRSILAICPAVLLIASLYTGTFSAAGLEPTAAPGGDSSGGADVAQSRSVNRAAPGPGGPITFGELPIGTAVSTQYLNSGVIFVGDSADDEQVIVSDTASPTSPVLSGTPKFQGTVAGYFVAPGTTLGATVGSISMDVGYINAPGSVVVRAFAASGIQLGQAVASSTGINRLTVTATGIAAFVVMSTATEPAGFAVDNVAFSHPVPATGEGYVALGDSYSAGEGIKPFFDTSRCHRSIKAYSSQVQVPFTGQTFYGSKAPYSYGTLTCSGDTTSDVLKHQLGNKPVLPNSHYASLGATTGLVTITVGGNDAKFADVLGFCGWRHTACQDDEFQHGKTLKKWVRAKLPKIQKDLVKVYQRIRALAPNARILVLGYPQLFPRSDAEQSCRGLKQRGPFGFSHGEQGFLRKSVSRLNSTISSAVSESGVAEYLDVAPVFAGHEVCGNSGSWVEGVNLRLGGHQIVKCEDKCFHPNTFGQTAYARAVNSYLTPQFRAAPQ